MYVAESGSLVRLKSLSIYMETGVGEAGLTCFVWEATALQSVSVGLAAAGYNGLTTMYYGLQTSLKVLCIFPRVLRPALTVLRPAQTPLRPARFASSVLPEFKKYLKQK